MKNKSLIILLAIIILAFIAKFGLYLYTKMNQSSDKKNIEVTDNSIHIDNNYVFSFDGKNYEFLTSSQQKIEKSSTGKIDRLDDKYTITENGKELMSLTFLPKETEKFLDQSYASYLEESININNLNGYVYKNNGKSVAYLLNGEKFDYLWINNDYINFDKIVDTFKQK